MFFGAQDSAAPADAFTMHAHGKRPGPVRRRTWPAAALLAAALACAALALALVSPGLALAEDSEGPAFADAVTTTGPTPPRGVLPPSTARGALAGVAAGEVLLGGVPAYIWHDGCAPTSLGMILAYWDAHGYPALIPGDASTQTRWADQAIASHGSGGAPRHFEDYALPMDTGATRLPDKSERPVGDEHASDSAADFMRTSWSSEGLAYGWTMIDEVGPAFTSFVHLRLAQATATTSEYTCGDPGDEDLTFAVLQREIDAGRPMEFYVDSDGNGVMDHAVAAVGYRETTGYPEYACWDTWYRTLRWETFQEVSRDYRWGVYGATAFALSGAPTPADITGPVALAAGGGDGWRRPPFTLALSATDDRAGVDFFEVDVDGAGWTSLAGLPARVAVTTQGEHVVRYRATDSAGNVGDPAEVTIRVDGQAPVTAARAARVRRGARVSLRYRVDDVTPRADVRLVVRTLSGRRRAVLRPGWRATGALLSASWRAAVPRGVYRVWVYATDEAGNHQGTPGSALLTVR